MIQLDVVCLSSCITVSMFASSYFIFVHHILPKNARIIFSKDLNLFLVDLDHILCNFIFTSVPCVVAIVKIKVKQFSNFLIRKNFEIQYLFFHE